MATNSPDAGPLEWAPLWDAMEARPDEWIETTDGMYIEMLECLPPRAYRSDGFLAGEPHHDDPTTGEPLFAAFIRSPFGRIFARYRTVAQFKGEQR